MSLQWNGEAVIKRSRDAMISGLYKAAAEGVDTAKKNVHKDTTTLEGAIRRGSLNEVGDQVSITFGVQDAVINPKTHQPVGDYAKYQEFLPPEKGGKPYMRPGRDEANRVLKSAIKAAW